MGEFVHLHLHSEYSLLDGACRVSDIPKAAKKAGHSAVAITDHGVMYGVVDFYKACKADGVKPIIGCEVYVAKRSLYDKDRDFDAGYYHLVLLVKNKTGYDNLIYMVSKSFTDGFYSKPRIDTELLEAHTEGLVCLSGCLAGQIPRYIVSGEYDKAEEYACRLDKAFGRGNFYLEIQDHSLADDKVVCEGIRRIHNATGIPMVATNDAHYIEKKDAETQAVLLCIQTNSVITDGRPIGFETDEFYYKSTEEMEALFADYEDACSNTAKIADMCSFDFEFGKTKLPRYKPENGQNPDDYLRALAYSGFEKKIADGHITFDGKFTRETYEKRIEYELSVITKMGYGEYYLIVWDFVHHSKSVGIPVGPGRGSGAGSLVAYLIGITDIDSIRFDLLFERFLNPERVSMPDFDIDFCYERRDEAIAYVREKYGEDHTSQIITFGTLAARAAVRDVGRALGMSYKDVDEVARLIPRELKITIDKALEGKELNEMYRGSAEIRRLIDLSRALEGMPRHSSIHAAGVVITEEPVTSYVPVAVNNGSTVTQFDMDTVAELGILKFDFLALRYLTIIDTAEKQIREKEPDFDLTKIDTSDAETYALISSGKSDGVFQLESPGMKRMLTELKPERLDDIIAAIALYRPGPMDSIPKYIEARLNPEKIEYCTPLLKPILDVTYGCIVYQEQVMQIFREIAGYSFGHADVVRRAISKKKAGVLESERQAFIDGAKEHGVDEKDAVALFEDIVSFANYAFNKSHAAAYAVLSFRTAYLKAHYPREYESALLTSVQSYTDKLTEYINDCSKQGIRTYPPDINKSRGSFHVDGDGIRFGLSAIKGIGDGLVDKLVNEREKNGEYKDIDDFIERASKTELNKRQLEVLIKSGALDSLGVPRRRLLAVHETMLENRSPLLGGNIEGQIGLFDAGGAVSAPKPKKIEFPNLPEFTMREKLALEKESCGIYFSGHVLDDYIIGVSRVKPDEIAAIRASFRDEDEDETPEEESHETDTPQYADKQRVKIVGVVAKRVMKSTKNGDRMAFVTIEDRGGSLEVLVFPKTNEKCGWMLTDDAVVALSGTLSKREEEDVKILAENILPLYPDAEADKLPDLTELDKTEYRRKTDAERPRPTRQTEKNTAAGEPKKIYIRVPSTESAEYKRSAAICGIFTGNTPVSFYATDKSEYLTEEFSVTPTDFVLNEICEIVGEENLVVRR